MQREDSSITIDLWFVPEAEASEDARLLARYSELCTAEERTRCGQFLLPRMQRQYLVTRALVRTVLSHYEQQPPEAWRFTSDYYGKPSVAAPQPPTVRFNLSHTDGLIICGVLRDAAGNCEIGVDIEHRNRRTAGMDLARRYFAAAEIAALEQLTEAEQAVGFFEYWTLKEAYVKARGMGLSLPLDQFAFELRPPGPPQIVFAQPGETAEDWSFAQFQFGPRHQGAVAVCGARGAKINLNLREALPLTDLCPTRG